MPGPFEGIRVVEFGRFIAAPYCAQLLADGGADVIKVEPLIGDDTRRTGEVIPGEGRQFLNKNRGKRSIAVDLNVPEVASAIQRLAAGADVVVANFRPGQSERIGLDYESLAAVNPRIIYAENTAFGKRGPMAGKPGMDLMMAAYTGLAPIGPAGPIDLEAPIVDYMAAMLLSWGVASALFHRERTGKGQKIDVSLLQASLVLQNNGINHIAILDNDWRARFISEARVALANGATWDDVLDLRTALSPHATNKAYYGFFRTADGGIAIAAPGNANRRKLLAMLEVDDRWVTEPGWLPDDAHAHVRRVHTDVAAKLATQPTAHWVGLLQAAGIPASATRFREELLADEQAIANDYFVHLEHELVGDLTVVAPPVRFSESPLHAETASPILGKHSRAVLMETGLTSDEVEALVSAGSIVAGD
ncbi:MAG: CaiB/BaiF CoA transferase family protein [Dehalococcoidia bacterium]